MRSASFQLAEFSLCGAWGSAEAWGKYPSDLLGRLMPTVTDQRVFLPTKDFARSLDFYSRIGWEVQYRDENLALISLGASRIFLQKYYQQEWADNTMLHLIVDDAAAWHELCERVKREGGFDEVRIRAPQREDYGALVVHVIDPAGVLLHFAQMVAP